MLTLERVPGKFNYPSVPQWTHLRGQRRQLVVPKVQLSEGGQVSYLGEQLRQLVAAQVQHSE